MRFGLALGKSWVLPLRFNLRRDPHQRAAEESGNDIEFLGENRRAFGPAKRIPQNHLATFNDFPTRSKSANANSAEIKERVGEDEVGQDALVIKSRLSRVNYVANEKWFFNQRRISLAFVRSFSDGEIAC